MPENVQKDANAPEGLEPTPPEEQMFPLEEIMKAQNTLRGAAKMAPERFPLPFIIGMISDEIQQLREKGRSDDEIAAMISGNSLIKVEAETLQKYYATPEQRQRQR